jgi:hypothetical protein
MMESDTGGHLCEGLEALAPTNAHRPQTGYLGSSEDTIAKNTPGRGNLAFSFEESDILGAHPELLGGFRDPDKSVVFHREDDDSAGL